MDNGFFFSEQWLKTNTAVTQNVDYQDIKPHIDRAQDLIIEPVIGLTLMNRLKESIVLQNWSQDELDLLIYIRPVAAYYTLYIALPFLQTKIRNKGVVMGADATIQTVSQQMMLDLRQETLEVANHYLAKLKRFMCLNSSKYPQYSDPNPLNEKTHTEPYDLGGFTPFKGYGLPNDEALILKMINYRYR
jgi:hypothetical protein